MPPPVLHHLAFRTRDIEELAAFYTSAVGLEVRQGGSKGRSIWLALGNAIVMIELADPGELQVNPGSMELVCFGISVDMLPYYRDRLLAYGVATEGETPYSIYFRDPDGRRVGLSHYPEVRSEMAKLDTPMTDKNGEIAPDGAASSRFAVIVRKGGRAKRVGHLLAHPTEFCAAFAAVEAASEDRKAWSELEHDLGDAFLLSPESVDLDSMSSYEQLFQFARGAYGRTALSLDGKQLAAIVFDLMPRKVLMDVEDAALLIGDLRLFYAFLRRVFAPVHAGDCLDVLGDGAVERLEIVLARAPGQ